MSKADVIEVEGVVVEKLPTKTTYIQNETFDKTGLIYGLGHAIYTESDPRCEIFKRTTTNKSSNKHN